MGIRLAVLMLACVSCAPAPWQWKGTTDFTAEERAQIEEAQSFICAKTNRECAPIEWTAPPGDTRPYVIVRYDSLRVDPRYASWQLEPFGMSDGTTGRTLLKVSAIMRRVTAHEFAHWTDMMHLPAGEHGLMNPDDAVGSNELVWTDADEAECLRVRCRN